MYGLKVEIERSVRNLVFDTQDSVKRLTLTTRFLGIELVH
jgi:hypothetical protein